MRDAIDRADTLDRAEARIRERLLEIDAIEANYLEYARLRLQERDYHGLWDVAINLSEVSCERDGLRLALEALVGSH